VSGSLAGRVAVVTGGASGIGRATALLLARNGARVFVGDFRPDEANEGLFATLGIVQMACDIRREQDVQQLIAAAVVVDGGLDILVNNAGIGMVKPITEVSEAEWDACLDTNLKGAFLAIKHSLAPMRERGRGTIVNISSNAGLLPRAHDPVYSISKAALIALTKSVALCHAPDNIRVNAVCPGPVCDTRMMDADLRQAADPDALRRRFIDASPLAKAIGRMITPEEVAEAVLYLASDAAALVTGTIIAIDGGKSLGVPPG
jgi:NAD(P)-dependent dehydrogenase (short-subunit alcohol dehydrogenase family)